MGGAVSDIVRREVESPGHGDPPITYSGEELAIANSVPTAEGAIQLAMEELPITISGARLPHHRLRPGWGRRWPGCW